MVDAYTGKVMTVLGPIAPEQLGAVLMHEHVYGDIDGMVEGATPPDRVELLRAYCAPYLKRLRDYGCYAFVDCTPLPMRAEPWVYQEMSRSSGFNIIQSTGFYREAAANEFRPCGASVPHRWMDPRTVSGSVDEIADIMVGEFEGGIRGSDVRPGVIKLATTLVDLTDAERKSFQAGAKAQRATGMAITTHAVGLGVAKSQLDTLEAAGADPGRVMLGHTNSDIVETPWVVRQCMDRGATFLATNLRVDGDPRGLQRLVNELNRLFDHGYGDRLGLGLDWAFENEQGPFIPCSFMPPPPYIYMFTHALPRLRELGLCDAAIQLMLVDNPARLLPLASI